MLIGLASCSNSFTRIDSNSVLRIGLTESMKIKKEATEQLGSQIHFSQLLSPAFLLPLPLLSPYSPLPFSCFR